MKLNLHPHFHLLMLDGVYVISEEGAAPEFVPAPPLRDADVQRIVEIAAHRLVRLLQQRGILAATEEDALAEEAPLPGCQNNSENGFCISYTFSTIIGSLVTTPAWLGAIVWISFRSNNLRSNERPENGRTTR